jgi:LPXTG-site transpeptidase (sortase) family protein
MIPDSTSRLVRRASRGLVRFTAGLALVAVAAACSASDDSVLPIVDSTPAPTPAIATPRDVTEESPEPTPTLSQSDSMKGSSSTFGTPRILRIPRIGVDAPVVPIQSNEERILEPPSDRNVVGWWSDGAAPGEQRGSAVLVGHSVRNEGGGVFDDMGDLGRGDAIEVEAADDTLSYRVQSIDVLSKEEVARNAEEIFAQSGTGRLVLVTCEDWDGKAWRSNIVTIAAPV